MDWHDEDILALLTTDLDSNYEVLVVKYIGPLCNYLEYKGASSPDAQDIVIEVFERAYFRLKSYSIQQLLELRLRPWLYKITDNLYINHVTRHRPPALVSLDTPEGSPLFEIEDDKCEQPERLLESAESRQELEDLVKALPKIFRDVIYLHFFADLTYQEIADILNQKVGTIRTNVSRGLRVLRQMLEKRNSEEQGGKNTSYVQ